MNNITYIKPYIQAFLLSFLLLASSGLPALSEEAPSFSGTSAEYSLPMEQAISNYKKIVENGGWPTLKTGKTIKAGMKDPRIPTIRQILSIMGDYQPITAAYDTTESAILDDVLAEAVKKFQTRHGLEADGDIGIKTQTALAVPARFRLAQLETTLEKMRAIPDLGGHYILVNIPAFYLRAVDNNKTVLSSRIIVGKPQNSTPLFHQPITEVIFNPKWYVPDSIAKKEFIEKILSEPDYLDKGNYIVKTRDGKTVNHSEIDWQNASGDEYKFIQRAGDNNALGKIKFNLPNTSNIYLHSTNSPRLFKKSERALSHGCIRVEKARELAYFVMKGLGGWNEERIDKFYDGSVSKMLKVNPVPVYLVYWTSWTDGSSGQPYFYQDIYSRDEKRMAEILATIKSKQYNNY